MIVSRPAADRGHVRTGWLDSRHTFSFGHYHDPAWMGFGPLRVINEDRVAPGAGFAPHRHANMEILSYVLSGVLAHRDDSTAGTDAPAKLLRAGELQWMGAGHGIGHSEFNGSDTEPVHFLQVWIQPDRVNAAPGHAQRAFDVAATPGAWVVLASPDGADGSLAIRQQAWLRAVHAMDGQRVPATLDPSRRYWLHVARGAVRAAGHALQAGDALGFEAEDLAFEIEGADGGGEVLLFDLPR